MKEPTIDRLMRTFREQSKGIVGVARRRSYFRDKRERRFSKQRAARQRVERTKHLEEKP